MSKRNVLLTVLLLLAGMASPILAATHYVPLVADQRIDGARVESQVRLDNGSQSEVRRARHLFLRSFVDGSDNTNKDGRLVAIDPGAAVTLRDLPRSGRSGFLRVIGSPDVTVESRLIGTSANGKRTVGPFAPAISDDDVFIPGAVAVLDGMQRIPGELRSDLHLLNLAQREATCTVSLARGNGDMVIDGVSLDVPAFTHLPVADALRVAGFEHTGSWSTAISCNRSFYSFLTRQNLVDGALDMVRPRLQPQAPENPGTPEDDPTPSGREVVFERPGVFHTPTKSKEMRTIQLPLRKGATYSKIVVDLNVTHGGWNPDSDGNHGIFWLNRHPNWGDNVFGYVNAFGPGKNLVKLTSNVGARRGQMWKSTTGVQLKKGQTYKVHFEYDTKRGVAWSELRTLDGRRVGGRVQLPTKVSTVRIKDPGGFFIAFGHTRHAVGPEVPTYGWKYSDLKVRFIQ